jgi:hypothetical protein
MQITRFSGFDQSAAKVFSQRDFTASPGWNPKVRMAGIFATLINSYSDITLEDLAAIAWKNGFEDWTMSTSRDDDTTLDDSTLYLLDEYPMPQNWYTASYAPWVNRTLEIDLPEMAATPEPAVMPTLPQSPVFVPQPVPSSVAPIDQPSIIPAPPQTVPMYVEDTTTQDTSSWYDESAAQPAAPGIIPASFTPPQAPGAPAAKSNMTPILIGAAAILLFMMMSKKKSKKR